MTLNQTPSQAVPFSSYKELWTRYLGSQRRRLLLLALLLFSGIGLQIVNPQILRFFIDSARAGSPLDALLQAALIFFAVALVSQLVAIAASYVGQWVSFAATNRMRADLMLHCLKLDLSFHNARSPGEMIARIDGDIGVLANFFSRLVLVVVGNALLILGILVVLWIQEWRLGLALTLWAGVAVVALNLARRRAVPLWRAVSQMGAEYSGFLEERLGGVEDIRANGVVPYIASRMAMLLRRLYMAQRMAQLMATGAVNVYLAMFVLGNLIALGFGSYLYSQNQISLGTVYLVFTYTSFMVIPLRELADQFQYLQQAGASIQRVQQLFATTSRIQEPAQARSLTRGALPVEFEHVEFAYGDADAVLHEVSFKLGAGRVMGVLGRTGSGKTTLSRLLVRLYDVNRGAVRLGGVRVQEVPLAELRGRVALVTQDVQLFNATIRDNLTFFNSAIPDSVLLQALDRLELGGWLAAQPRGLDTPLASGGGGLSAGQAQLLAFARAFLRDPGLVILDEASSRLDPATEHLIERAVRRLLLDRTAIIIAHHLTTVLRADEILIIEEGRIREHGARAALAVDPRSRFHQLLQTGLEEVLA